MKKTKSDVFWGVLTFLAILFITWVFISFIDTNIHNGDLNPDYSSWNFFEIALKSKGV